MQQAVPPGPSLSRAFVLLAHDPNPANPQRLFATAVYALLTLGKKEEAFEGYTRYISPALTES